MSKTIEVKIPDIGDYKDVEVIEVLVKAGDTVAKEQSLITLESDKASMEIPSPDAGVVKEMVVKLGDKLSRDQRCCARGWPRAARRHRNLLLRHLRPPYRPAASQERRTSNATCWCWAQAPGGIRPLSAPPISD